MLTNVVALLMPGVYNNRSKKERRVAEGTSIYVLKAIST